jgi:hypothetical protein
MNYGSIFFKKNTIASNNHGFEMYFLKFRDKLLKTGFCTFRSLIFRTFCVSTIDFSLEKLPFSGCCLHIGVVWLYFKAFALTQTFFLENKTNLKIGNFVKIQNVIDYFRPVYINLSLELFFHFFSLFCHFQVVHLKANKLFIFNCCCK